MLRFFLIFAAALSWAASDPCHVYIYGPNGAKHGYVPAAYHKEVVDILRAMPDSVFERNPYNDIYSFEYTKLGPFTTIGQRRAVMIHVLETMAALESDWRWTAGVDTANSSSLAHVCEQEAGSLQTSANILDFGANLKKYFQSECAVYKGTGGDCKKFINCSKANHTFQIGIAAMALRRELNGVSAVRHWGPLRRGEIQPYLSRACVKKIEGEL